MGKTEIKILHEWRKNRGICYRECHQARVHQQRHAWAKFFNYSVHGKSSTVKRTVGSTKDIARIRYPTNGRGEVQSRNSQVPVFVEASRCLLILHYSVFSLATVTAAVTRRNPGNFRLFRDGWKGARGNLCRKSLIAFLEAVIGEAVMA